MDVEELAQILHESGRESVEKGDTYVNTPRAFIEWGQLDEHMKDGRRSQAQYLLLRLDIKYA